MKRLLLILSFILCSCQLDAATYYVSAGGHSDTPSDSNSCATAQTITTPKATIVNAMACLSAGDTLYVRGGTYVQNITNPTLASGTSFSNAPYIAAYPGSCTSGCEMVTVKSDTNTQDVLHFSGAYAYIIFDGINLDGTGSFADVVKIEDGFNPSVGSHHIRLENLSVKNPGTQDINSGGVSVQTGNSGPNGGGGDQFINLTVSGVHGGTGGQGDGSHGFYISSLNNLIEKCNISDYHGAGIQLQANFVAATGNIVRKNFIHDPYLPSDAYNRRWGIVVSEDGSTETGDLIYDNVIYNISDPGGTSPHWGYGIHVFAGRSTEIYNNTVYNAATIGIFLDSTSTNTNLDIENNIAYSNGTNYSDTSPGPTTNKTNSTNGTNPIFVTNGSNFHLQSSSPEINAGTTLSAVPDDLDGNSRPQGAAYDIGAYEFISSSAPGTPVLVSPALHAVNQSTTSVTLSCTASGATSFTLFGPDAFNPPTTNHSLGGTCSFTASGLIKSTKYYWQIQAVNAGGTNKGAVWDFGTEVTFVNIILR